MCVCVGVFSCWFGGGARPPEDLRIVEAPQLDEELCCRSPPSWPLHEENVAGGGGWLEMVKTGKPVKTMTLLNAFFV